ncbi:MAG: hypothetical protein R8P61_31565 [Bacteroidia bacterium]|nr:hypothetical protein [Bacteroidia bacterium]
MEETNVEVSSTLPDPIQQPSSTHVHDTVVMWSTLQTEMGLLRGFQVDISDFTNIVRYARQIKRKSGGKKSIDSVYVMLAINPSETGRQGYRIKYLDFYFQAVETDNESGKSSLITFYRPESYMDTSGFEDFPKPCPFSCPPGE